MEQESDKEVKMEQESNKVDVNTYSTPAGMLKDTNAVSETSPVFRIVKRRLIINPSTPLGLPRKETIIFEWM